MKSTSPGFLARLRPSRHWLIDEPHTLSRKVLGQRFPDYLLGKRSSICTHIDHGIGGEEWCRMSEDLFDKIPIGALALKSTLVRSHPAFGWMYWTYLLKKARR